MTMNDLQAFFQQLTPQAEEVTVWGNGQIPLRSVCYFCQELPPLEFITSVRGIVLRDDQVLVVRNRDELHIMPGGRREKGEQLLETLQREILEETGWLSADYRLIGVLHFHHLAPMLPDYPYLYPDFLHLIYTARALKYIAEAKLADDYEFEARFVPVEEAMRLPFAQSSQIALLEQAIVNRDI